MKKSHARLYLPFIALAVAQAAFVLVAPSRGEKQNLFAGDTSEIASGNGTTRRRTQTTNANGEVVAGDVVDENGDPVDAGGDPSTPGATTPGATNPDTGTIDPGVNPGTNTTLGTATGSTAHCRNGRQTDVLFNAPPCAPKFSGNNGGSTYPGVTAKEVKLVLFECQPNEQVNAVLKTQGLAATREETDAMVQASVDFFNKTYELYGRKIVWSHVVGDCPSSPEDPAKSRQAATEVAKTKPAIVIHYATGPITHDVWTQNGIISLGGPNLDNAFYANRRPYRYDVFPSGTEGADEVAEYYCKKLKGGKADHGGALIHRSIGGKDTPRKLGVIVPDNGTGASTPNAARVKQKVEACGGGDVAVFTYSSDISRAAEQTRVTVAGLISAKVTTVACMCDAVAPVFLTKGMTTNAYFPEHLLPGANLLDYDILGRLYDPQQWVHAFGPSQLVNPIEFQKSDAQKIWKASGRSGDACASCNLITGYMSLVGSMIQNAGPTFTPLNVEKSSVGAKYSRGGWVETKGDPSQYLIKFGPGDYNAISDYREVYWDANSTSAIDGKKGAYVPMNGGRRYQVGEIGNDFTVPAK